MFLRAVQKVLLIAATAIWLLHSVVPHLHEHFDHDVMSSVERGQVDFLGVLFSADLGEGHLEIAAADNQSDLSDQAFESTGTLCMERVVWGKQLNAKPLHAIPPVHSDPTMKAVVKRGPPVA